MAARREGLRIVVLGYVVRGPLGGMVWSNLQYLRGLAALGHEVWFAEDSDDHPSCYDPSRHVVGTNPGYGLGFAQTVFARIGLGERWAYHDAHAGCWRGPAADRMRSVLATAEVLLDLCGVNAMRPWLLDIPLRVLVDEDPAFTQIRHLSDPSALQSARSHNAFFSFATNWGRPACTVPDDGLPWRPTRQPLVLDSIVPSPGPRQAAFTTVMQWDSYPARVHQGRHYGLKSDSLLPLIDLPARVHEMLELALGGAQAPRSDLRSHGWRVVDPLAPTRDPWTYEAYLAASKAEFSVAKQAYVVTGSGWFSERSVAYLASGRPVVVQDTAFSDWLPTGLGAVAFSSADEAVAAIEDVAARYDIHCRTARDLVEAHFDARQVLGSLIDEAHAALAGPAPAAPAGARDD